MGSVKVRNTTVNGGMTGRDKTINKVFAFKNGKNYSQMKTFATGSALPTVAQRVVRDTFSQTSIGWSNLDEEDRSQWNSAAPDWVNTDVFGNKSQSGKNLYTGANIALVGSGRDIISEPQARDIACAPNEASVTILGGNLVLDVTFAVTSPDDVLQLRVSKQLSAGTSVNSKFVTLGNYPCVSIILLNETSKYVAKYGALQAGKKVFYEIRLVSKGGNSVKYASGYADVQL